MNIQIFLRETLPANDGMTALIYDTSRTTPNVGLALDRSYLRLTAENIGYVVPVDPASGREWNLLCQLSNELECEIECEPPEVEPPSRRLLEVFPRLGWDRLGLVVRNARIIRFEPMFTSTPAASPEQSVPRSSESE